MTKLIQNGWFCEINDLWHGQAMSLEIEKILVEHKSKYQDILIFKSKSHGKVLILDGIIQLTEKDECSYQEMITFLPLNSHPNPKKVLVIGAGDGGVIREISKHPLVESIVQCEIDEDVVKLSKKYLPQMSCGYSSPKHKLHIGCGKEFMRQHKGEFDVVITDSSDPDGPAETLFQKEYYELIRSALKPDGMLASQGQCPFLDCKFMKTMMEFCKPLFPIVQYCYTNVPTYPSGQIGFLMCSRNNATVFEQPVTKFTQEQMSSLNIQFYNADVHTAAFALPQFFEKMTEDYDGSSFTDNNNWFWEKLKNGPGQSFGLVKKKVLFQEKTNDQEVLVFQSYVYKNVFVLDDVIQFTETDVYGFQETMTHLSLNSHRNPKKVLILGGLNGGIIQEVSRHHEVETIVQCEINEKFLEVSKKYFSALSTGYNSPKLKDLHIGDYLQYLKQHPHEFDVIITVPIEMFSTPDANKLLRSALKPHGIAISKVSSFWLDLDNIHNLVKHEKTLYPVVRLAYSCVPSSPCGQATFLLRSLNPETNFHTPLRQLSSDILSQLEFYNPEVHTASFALPEFVKMKLNT